MDWKKLLTILIIGILIFGGVKAYHYFGRSNQNIIEYLSLQRGAILKLQTDIADIEKRVVNDTLKETTVVKGETYSAVKEELLELRKDEKANAQEIKKLREVFENRISEFRESPDKIMVKAGDEKVVIYEDTEGNLVSLDEGVEIIRHRKTEHLKPDLQAGQTEQEINKKFSLSMLYDGEIHPAVSYSVVGFKDIDLNLTAYDLNFPKLGADVSYSKDRFVVGGGAGLVSLKDMEMIKEFYVRFGIKF